MWNGPNKVAATVCVTAIALANELGNEAAMELSAVLKQLAYTIETVVIQRENRGETV